MSAPEPRQRRRDTLRQLRHPAHMRDSFVMSRQPWLRNSILVGLQASLATAIALPLVLLSPWPDMLGFAALGALTALFGRLAPAKKRNRIVFYCGLTQCFAVLSMSLLAWAGAPEWLMLAGLALLCGLFYLLTLSQSFGPPGALIFVFAASASMGDPGGIEGVAARVAATALIAVLALAICALFEPFRPRQSVTELAPAAPLPPLRQRLLAALRITLACLLCLVLALALGLDHPAWAAMGTMAVMQGAQLHISLSRAVQRMLGTALGAALAWVVLTAAPPIAVLIVILVVLQVVTEMVIGSNYGLGQIFVTPMALLMTHLAMPSSYGAEIASARVVDTVFGALIGLGMALLLSSQQERRQFAQHHALRLGSNPPPED